MPTICKEDLATSPRITASRRRNIVMNGAQRCEMHNRAVCRWVGWEWSGVQSSCCCHFGQEQLCTQL